MFGIDDLIGAGLKILDKVIPDPAAKAEAQLKLLQLKQAGEFKDLEADLAMATAQTSINATEAASTDTFVSGWRPFIGWTCGVAFAVNFVVGPCGQWFMAIFYQRSVPFPQMDIATMMPVLLGMLGLGAMRSFEKKNGVA